MRASAIWVWRIVLLLAMSSGRATPDKSGERYEVDTGGELRECPGLSEFASAQPSLAIDGEASNQ